MKRRLHVNLGCVVLAMALLVTVVAAQATPLATRQTMGIKGTCDEAAGASGSRPKTLVVAQVARCLDERGEHVKAVERLQAQLKEMDQQGAPHGRAALETSLKTILAKVGILDIQTIDGAEVVVDDRIVGRSPNVNMVLVEPGSHVIQVRKDGVEAKKTLDVVAGSTAVVELPIEPKKVEPSKPLALPPKDPAWRTPTMIVGGGVALAGIIFGIVNVIAANEAEANRTSLVASFPPGSSKCSNVPAAERCRNEAELVAQGKRASGLAGLGFVLGGIGVAAFTTAIVWPRVSNSPKKNDGRAAVSFVPLQGGGGIMLRGDF